MQLDSSLQVSLFEQLPQIYSPVHYDPSCQNHIVHDVANHQNNILEQSLHFQLQGKNNKGAKCPNSTYPESDLCCTSLQNLLYIFKEPNSQV